MTILECSYPSCVYRTDDVEITGAVALLTLHGLTHPNTTPQPPTPTSASAVIELDEDIDFEVEKETKEEKTARIRAIMKKIYKL